MKAIRRKFFGGWLTFDRQIATPFAQGEMLANTSIEVARSTTEHLTQRCRQRRKCIKRWNAEHHDHRQRMFFEQVVDQPIDGAKPVAYADQGGDVVDASRKKNDRYPVIFW